MKREKTDLDVTDVSGKEKQDTYIKLMRDQKTVQAQTGKWAQAGESENAGGKGQYNITNKTVI